MPSFPRAWAIAPWIELCENSVALVGLYSAWSVWARVRAMDEHAVLTDEDTAPDRNELLHRSKDLAAEIGQVRTMLDHIHSLQLTRSVQQSQLFHSLLEAGEVTVAEQNLRGAIDALERQHDSVVAQSDRAWQEMSERREIAFEVILAFLAATGVTGLLGWVNAEFPGFDARHPRWDVYVFLVWVAVSIPLIVLATGLTRHLPWRKGRPGEHRSRRRPRSGGPRDRSGKGRA